MWFRRGAKFVDHDASDTINGKTVQFRKGRWLQVVPIQAGDFSTCGEYSRWDSNPQSPP